MVDVYPKIKDWIVREFDVDWDEKGAKTLRQEAKNKWVFPQLFGSSPRSCATNLHLPEEVAEKLAKEFWDEFPDVLKWQKRLMQRYEKTLYVETLGGRRRRGPMTRNEIINTPIQGTAADIVLEGMNALSEQSLILDLPDIHPILNVHDDLTEDMADGTLEENIKLVAIEMCRHRFSYINVPLVVEVKVGQRWGDMQEIEVLRSDKLFNLRNPFA